MLQFHPDPVPERTPRHDGITPERQEEFLVVLAATGSITEAAAAIGISRTALYKLRANPAAEAFRERWAEALREATAVLAGEAFERALHGKSEPVWYKGEQIGERVRHNDRLLMFLLRSHDPATYARPEETRTVRARANPCPDPSTPPAASLRINFGEAEGRGTVDPTAARSSGVSVSTSSTSPAGAAEEMTDEDFRAELRTLRSSPELPRHLSKRNARRLAAKGRLPLVQPT
jgi:hypothetical protein